MAHVDPNDDKAGKVRRHNGVVDVVESLGRGEEEVTNVVGDVDGDANVGEMEAVAQANEGQADDVVTHKLLEVLSRLLHSQEEDNGLLGPVGSLEEVVKLDDALVRAVGEALIHAAGVEVPDGRAAHDVHASRSKDAKVKGGIHLLHETGLLALAEARHASQWAQDLLHDELASKGQDDGVEGDERNVPLALAIVDGLEGVVLGHRVRQEEKVV